MRKLILLIQAIIVIAIVSSFTIKNQCPDGNIISKQIDQIESEDETEHLKHYLSANWKSPEEYVIEKFTTKDVVFLSEDHAVRQNLIFSQNIIPKLYEAGVYNFGMEFGASEDQARLDSLITAPEYDEDIAREIMFSYNVGWVFNEYMDIYRTAWKLNHSLPAEAKKFRILNLSYRFDWTNCHLYPKGLKTPVSVKRIFHKGGTERYRAGVIKKEILDKKEKILVLTGGLHAFTKFNMPVYDYYSKDFYRFENRTLGNLVYKMEPNKVFTILLHYPFNSKTMDQMVQPANGKLEELMMEFKNKQVGFDLGKTPMGKLKDSSYYSIGRPEFTMGDIADGYIFLDSFENLDGCAIDNKFLTKDNWDEAKRNFPDQDMRSIPSTLEEYLMNIKNYVDLNKRYVNIK